MNLKILTPKSPLWTDPAQSMGAALVSAVIIVAVGALCIALGALIPSPSPAFWGMLLYGAGQLALFFLGLTLLLILVKVVVWAWS